MTSSDYCKVGTTLTDILKKPSNLTYTQGSKEYFEGIFTESIQCLKNLKESGDRNRALKYYEDVHKSIHWPLSMENLQQELQKIITAMREGHESLDYSFLRSYINYKLRENKKKTSKKEISQSSRSTSTVSPPQQDSILGFQKQDSEDSDNLEKYPQDTSSSQSPPSPTEPEPEQGFIESYNALIRDRFLFKRISIGELRTEVETLTNGDHTFKADVERLFTKSKDEDINAIFQTLKVHHEKLHAIVMMMYLVDYNKSFFEQLCSGEKTMDGSNTFVVLSVLYMVRLKIMEKLQDDIGRQAKIENLIFENKLQTYLSRIQPSIDFITDFSAINSSYRTGEKGDYKRKLLEKLQLFYRSLTALQTPPPVPPPTPYKFPAVHPPLPIETPPTTKAYDFYFRINRKEPKFYMSPDDGKGFSPMDEYEFTDDNTLLLKWTSGREQKSKEFQNVSKDKFDEAIAKTKPFETRIFRWNGEEWISSLKEPTKGGTRTTAKKKQRARRSRTAISFSSPYL